MIDTILFDLDGTLLPIDMDDFMEVYINELYKEFKRMPDPKVIIEKVMRGVEAMINNNGEKTNCEVFEEKFSELVEGSLDIYMERFDSFYENGYLEMEKVVQGKTIIKEDVHILKEKGYNLVVATNPLFPKEAILKRIEWAELNPHDFIHITTYENSSYSKPNIGYYREILKKINKIPKQCMMVGNDVQEDIVAAELGIKTYLITNFISNINNDKIKCDYMGTYNDFHNFVQGLKPVKNPMH